MPVFHTWKFKYPDIESAARITSSEAQKLVSEYPGVSGPGQYYELDRDLAHLIIYSSLGEIEPNYQSPAAPVFNTKEDFVLLKAKMNGKPVRFLLSPRGYGRLPGIHGAEAPEIRKLLCFAQSLLRMAVIDPQCCGGSIFALVFGLVLVYGGTQRYLLIQKIKNTPTSKVRSAAAGLVELFGKATCKEDMKSPVSLAKSVFWRLHGEYYQSGKHGGWRTIFQKASSIPFYLEDDTGKMLIDPKDAEIDIPVDYQCTGYISDRGFFGLLPQQQLDKKVLDLIERDPEIGNRFRAYSGRQFRITEYFIAEGDPLYVFGNAVPLKGASSPLAHENLIIKKPNDAPMYISDSHEKKTIDKLNWSMMGMLAFGLALTAIGLFMLLTMFFV